MFLHLLGFLYISSTISRTALKELYVPQVDELGFGIRVRIDLRLLLLSWMHRNLSNVTVSLLACWKSQLVRPVLTAFASVIGLFFLRGEIIKTFRHGVGITIRHLIHTCSSYGLSTTPISTPSSLPLLHTLRLPASISNARHPNVSSRVNSIDSLRDRLCDCLGDRCLAFAYHSSKGCRNSLFGMRHFIRQLLQGSRVLVECRRVAPQEDRRIYHGNEQRGEKTE